MTACSAEPSVRRGWPAPVISLLAVLAMIACMVGAGRDILTGGSGADRFIYSELSDSAYLLPDTVVDFEQGLDKVVFRGAFREAGDLHFIGQAEFSHTPGEVRFEVSSTSTGVLIDMDGDAAAGCPDYLSDDRHPVPGQRLLLLAPPNR